MISGDPIVAGAAALAELKAYLRINHGQEDALLERLIASSMGLCEQFTGQALIARGFAETLRASGAWARLGRRPVRAVGQVEVLSDGSASVLPVESYAVDIDASGAGWVRLTQPAGTGSMRVSYSAGMAEGCEGLPEALRQGIVRLAAHLFTHRDDTGDEGPPAVVTALWRPYRRMRLG